MKFPCMELQWEQSFFWFPTSLYLLKWGTFWICIISFSRIWLIQFYLSKHTDNILCFLVKICEAWTQLSYLCEKCPCSHAVMCAFKHCWYRCACWYGVVTSCRSDRRSITGTLTFTVNVLFSLILTEEVVNFIVYFKDTWILIYYTILIYYISCVHLLFAGSFYFTVPYYILLHYIYNCISAWIQEPDICEGPYVRWITPLLIFFPLGFN